MKFLDRTSGLDAVASLSKGQSTVPQSGPEPLRRELSGHGGQLPGRALARATEIFDTDDGAGYGADERAAPQQRRLPSNARVTNTSKQLLAGAVAAIVARTVVAPLERLKLEYIVRGAKGTMASTFLNILRSEGVCGFWRGNTVNLLRTAPFKAINYASFDAYRKQLLRARAAKEISNLERLACGAAAGITATVLCFPLDTVRTRMIAQGGPVAFGHVPKVALTMVAAEGPLSLYRGLLPAILSMAPSGAVFYGTYDLLRSSFLRSPAGERHLQLRAEQESLERAAAAERGGGQAWDRRRHMEIGALRTLLFGAISGAAAEAATYPFEVVRRQMQLQGRCHGSGLARAVRTVAARGGPSAFYAGLFPSTLQVLPSAALSYFVYEFLKANMKVD